MLSKKQMFHQVMFTTPSFMHVRFESRNHKTTTITTCILQITKFATCMGQTDSHKQNCPVINRTTGKRLHPRRNAKQTVDFQGLWWKWHSTRGKKKHIFAKTQLQTKWRNFATPKPIICSTQHINSKLQVPFSS